MHSKKNFWIKSVRLRIKRKFQKRLLHNFIECFLEDDPVKNYFMQNWSIFWCVAVLVSQSRLLSSDMTRQMSRIRMNLLSSPAQPGLFLTLFNLLLLTVKSETKEWRHIRSRDEMKHLKTYFALWNWQG